MATTRSAADHALEAQILDLPLAAKSSKLKLVSGNRQVSPRLTLAELAYPAYLVNANFEIEWCNRAAEEMFLGVGRSLPVELAARPVFSTFFSSGQLAVADGRDNILNFHIAIAKHRMSKAALIAANAGLGAAGVQLLADLYDSAEPVETRDLITTEINLASDGQPEQWHHLYAAFFREGILFSFAPAMATSDALASLLSHRDAVIREVLKHRRPYLTKLAVLVADLESSVKICAELPPEDYFALINEIWQAVGRRLRKYHATHGKHVGDGLLYYFLPQPDSNCVFNAILCAHEMRSVMADINEKWKARKGWLPELRLNIGVDEGEEWIGTYQTPTHMEISALGDTINRTARLSDFAHGGSICVTKNTLSKLSAAERERIRFGIRRSINGEERIALSSYSRVSDLVDVLDSAHRKLRDISSLTVTEIFDVAPGEVEPGAEVGDVKIAGHA